LWNDVSGIIDEKTIAVLREHPESDYVYCHNLAPTRAQTSFHKDFIAPGNLTDFLDHLKAYFQKGLDFFKKDDLQERVYFDPCFGFSKTLKHNEYLLKNLRALINHFPKEMKWVVGISKKSFLREAIKERRSSSQDWGPVEFLHTGFLSLWFAQLHDHKLVMRVHNPNVFHGALKAQAMMDDRL
jgi:dihydropteroate synthase